MDTTLQATKIFNFEMAHALLDYDGDCKNIHGHSYRLYITVEGQPIEVFGHPNNGMIIDFKKLKSIVNYRIITPYDHALVLHESSPPKLISALKETNNKVILESFQPTCENLTLNFVSRIQNELPEGVYLKSVKLYETATSYVEWNKTKGS